MEGWLQSSEHNRPISYAAVFLRLWQRFMDSQGKSGVMSFKDVEANTNTKKDNALLPTKSLVFVPAAIDHFTGAISMRKCLLYHYHLLTYP